MVRGDKENEWRVGSSVLSPRTVMVGKAGARRTTMGGEARGREREGVSRLSAVVGRGSMIGGKGAWR